MVIIIEVCGWFCCVLNDDCYCEVSGVNLNNIIEIL